MRRFVLLLAVLPLLAEAAPDVRRRTTFAQDDGSTTCTFRPGFTQCSDGRTITTTRAAPAIPCGEGTAAVNTACILDEGMQCYGAGTVRPGCDADCKADVHTISTEGWPTEE